jgi:hypothetical protein
MVPLNLLATARSLLRWPVSSPPILPPTSSTGASLSEEWVRSGQDHPVLVCVYYCRTYYLVLDRMDGPSYFFLQVCSEGTRGPVHTVPGVRVDNWLRTLPQRQRSYLCFFLLCRRSAKIFGRLLVTSCLEENYNPLEQGGFVYHCLWPNLRTKILETGGDFSRSSQTPPTIQSSLTVERRRNFTEENDSSR